MKRIIYSCLFLISICLLGRVNAQVVNFTFTPGHPANTLCYNATGTYSVNAAYIPNNPAATSYTWTFSGPNGTCIPTYTPLAGGAPSNSFITITFPCCGVFTINSFAVNGPNLVGTITKTFEIICPTASNATLSTAGGTSTTNGAICIGASATITPSGAATYTWSNGFVGSPLIVSPTVNTCYTYTGTTAQGCTVSPLAGNCVSVQAITGTVSLASQTMCAGSPVHFTATAGIATGSSVTPGTLISGYTWFNPTPTQFASTNTNALSNSATTLAIGGNYSVVITHTGVAGSCSLTLPAAVVISTSIPVSIAPINPSVCPGAAITLTAVSIQTTAATNHTWTFNSVSGTTVAAGFGTSGRTITRLINPITTVTVNVNYFGCPGEATTTIGLLTLTPTLTSSSGLFACPGQSLTLTASGATTYTFFQTPNPGGTTFLIPKASPTISTVAHTPSGVSLPIQYCVGTASAGCTGTTCIVVDTKTLYPTLTASSLSVCPGTEVTFTATTNGTNTAAGANYTFSAGYTPFTINTGTNNILIHTPTGAGTVLPQTFTVTADSLGCVGTATVTIEKLILKPILSSASPSICGGTSVTINASGGAGTNYTFMASQASFTPAPNPTLTTITSTNNSVIHYPPVVSSVNYTVYADSSGCNGTGTYSIGLLDLGPKINLTTLPLSGSVCPGSTVVIQATGAINYTFIASPSVTFANASAPNGTTIASGTVTSVSAPIPLSGVIYTVVGDSSSCVGSKTIAVYEFKLHYGIVATPTLVCKGIPVDLKAIDSGGNPATATSYTFYALTPPVPLPSQVPSAPGSYSTTHNPIVQTVYSVLADSGACVTALPPKTVTVNIRPDIPLLISASAASVCPGLTSTLSVFAPTTTLTYTYSWLQVAGTATITPPVNTPTLITYPVTPSTFSASVLDPLGCTGSTVITIGINPALNYSIMLASSGSTICSGQSVSLTASSTVALNNNSIGTINYTWTPSLGITPNLGSTVIASPAVTTIYTVTADNGYGCVSQNTIDVPVGVYPNPSIAATANTICPGFTSTLTAFGGNTYTWTSPGSFTGSIIQQSISVVDGFYQVVASNGGGCISTTVITIYLGGPLNISVTPQTATTCITSNTPKFSKPILLTASGAGTYVWFPYNPLHMTYSLGPQTYVRPPTTTQYTIVGSTANCSGVGFATVTVIPQFTMNVVPPLPAMCYGDSVQLRITNIEPGKAVGPVTSYTYNWTEALNAPPISISSYFSPTVTVFPLNTTTYTTEVWDSRACVSLPRLVTVTVLPQPLTTIAIPTINSVATNTVCFVGLNPGAQDVTINLTGNNLNTGLQFGVIPTYTWVSPYGPNYNSILTPANNNAVTVSAPIKFLNNSSVVVYTLISGYNGVAGCKRMDTVSVRVIDCRPVRNVKFTTAEPNDTICARNCITYINQTDTMSGGPQTYTWTFRGGSPARSNELNPTVCYNFPGRYDVVLRVANPYPVINSSGGAPGSTLAIGSLGYVKVVDVPNVTIVSPGQIRSDTIVRFGQSVNLNGSGAFTYEWSPGYNITSLTKPKVTVNPFKTTQYILRGYNSKGCYSSDTINVIVVEDCGEMYVPNAFTPNNDGANDVLYVRGICLQSLTFMVFNRWGEKVFETADQKLGWDGTYKGEEMNTGVFVYRLEGKTYDGKGFSAKGNITLIR